MNDDWLLELGDHDPKTGPFHCRGAQWLMSGHNVFRHEWYHGEIDGDFGAASAAAAKQCKNDIGYTLASIKPTFGPLLAAYLKGTKKTTPAMRARARLRAKKFVWPTNPHGTVIGFPGVGTHSFTQQPNNWESDKAYDIAVPEGSQAIAIADGVIGPAFGPLPDPDPRFHGIRLHLVTADNEGYYAHLKSTFPGIGPGVHVKQGQILGATGHANGVEHLHFALKFLVPLEQI